MKISIFCMILPRLEVDFLEEWITYHLKIGIDNIYIYNNGEISTDHRVFSNSIPNSTSTWRKKPSADYNKHVPYEKLLERLKHIVAKYPQVHLKSWDRDFASQGEEEPDGKLAGYKDCVINNKSNWWVHIDPDEYIFPKKHGNIKTFLRQHPNINTFHVTQRVFEPRKKQRPVLSNKQWGYDCKIIKSMVKNPIKKLHIHKSKSYGKKTRTNKDELCIYHYRTNDDQPKNLHTRFKKKII